jgi:hypothetical protein
MASSANKNSFCFILINSLTGEPGGEELETKISMFADDTNCSKKMNVLLINLLKYFQNMKRHLDQELIKIKQKLFLLALLAIENQHLIKYHGLRKMYTGTGYFSSQLRGILRLFYFRVYQL